MRDLQKSLFRLGFSLIQDKAAFHFVNITSADTRLSGNDIIQKYLESLFLFIIQDNRQSHRVPGVSWELHGQMKTSVPDLKRKKFL